MNEKSKFRLKAPAGRILVKLCSDLYADEFQMAHLRPKMQKKHDHNKSTGVLTLVQVKIPMMEPAVVMDVSRGYRRLRKKGREKRAQ